MNKLRPRRISKESRPARGHGPDQGCDSQDAILTLGPWGQSWILSSLVPRQWLRSVAWVPSVISPLLTHICGFLDVSGFIIEKSQGNLRRSASLKGLMLSRLCWRLRCPVKRLSKIPWIAHQVWSPASSASDIGRSWPVIRWVAEGAGACGIENADA